MKEKTKNYLKVLIAMLSVVGLTIVSDVKPVQAYTSSEITQMIESHRAELNGKYWNKGLTGTTNILFATTTSPCPGSDRAHGCTSNTYNNGTYIGSQCVGFVRSFSHYLFGSPYDYWTTVSYSEAEPGDVISTGGHVAMISSREGDVVKIVECWGTSYCKINYGYYNGSNSNKTLSQIVANYRNVRVYRHPGGGSNANKTPTISASGLVSPSGTLKQGKNFALIGVVSTDCGTISIEGGVYDTNGNPVSGFVKNYSSASGSINIRSTLNNYVIFNNLQPGNYQYILKAYAQNGNLSASRELVHNSFAIQGESSAAPTPAPTPTPEPEDQIPNLSVSSVQAPTGVLKQGQNFGLRGIITTDCGQVTSVAGYVYNAAGSKVPGFSSVYNEHTGKFDLRYSINNDFIFNNLEPGNYQYVIIATAQNGSKEVSKEMIHTSFSVEGTSPSVPTPTPEPTPEPTPTPVTPVTPEPTPEPTPAPTAPEPTPTAPEPTPEPTPAPVVNPVISISGQTLPNATHQRGRNFAIRGIVSSNPGTLKKVQGYVADLNGNAISGFYSGYDVNATEFDLRYTINEDLIFNNLKAGEYRYIVDATAEYNGSTVCTQLIDVAFSVR